MKTNIDIKDKVFEALNVSDVTDTIEGTLYNGKRPATKEIDEDITIVPLPTDSEFVQSATINVNCYAKDIVEGVPDYSRLNIIFGKVESALYSYSSTEYFDIDIASQHIMDAEIKGWSFLNVRLNCKMLKS